MPKVKPGKSRKGKNKASAEEIRLMQNDTEPTEMVVMSEEREEELIKKITSSVVNSLRHGVAIFLGHTHYKYTCCGFIYLWEFFVSSTTGLFEAQIWGYTGNFGGGTFKPTLQGYDNLTADVLGYGNQTILNGARIRCRNNDYIAIHSYGSFPLQHANQNNGHNRYKIFPITTSMTSPYTWSTSDNQDQDYPIYSSVTPSKVPTINPINDVIYYNDELSVGMDIVTVITDDEDIEDQSSLTLTFTSTQTYFQIVSGTNKLQDNITLKATPPVGNYTLTLQVQDICGQQSITSFKVAILNRLPVINNLPKTISIPEDTAANALIFTINATDTVTDPVTCSMSGGSTATLTVKTTTSGVYTKPGVVFNYDTQITYTATIRCTDGLDYVYGVLTINLIRNEPPTIYSLPASTSFSEDLAVRTLIHHLYVNDTEGDTINCTLNPNSSIFDVSHIPPSTSEYGIYLTGGTTLDYDTKSSYLLQVQCADHRRSTKGNFTVNLIRNTPPVIYSLPATISFSEDLAVRTLIHNLFVNDTDGDTITCTLNPNSTIFDVSHVPPSTTEYGIFLTGGKTLDYDTTPSYLLQVQCADRRRSTKGNYTVNLIRNMPPTILNLPMSCDIPEDTQKETLIYPVSLNDPTNDTVTCSILSNTSLFYIQIGANQFQYNIFVKSNPGFSYDTLRSFKLNMLCADQRRSDSDYFYIYLIRNQPPKFTNLQGKTTVSSTLSSTGNLVFTVMAYNRDNDQLQFSMVASANVPFSINQNTGEVTLTRSILMESVTGYDLFISVYDGKNTVGPNTLTVLITDINSPPVFKNLPQTVSLLEGVTVGAVVFRPQVDDQNHMDVHSFSMFFNPPDGAVYFTINKTDGRIITLAAIDYETIAYKTFLLTLTVSDSFMSDIGNLTINILNVNEAPKFTKKSYMISADEGTAGTVLQNPYYQCSDPEGDTLMLSFDCGANTGRLNMNKTNGFLSYAIQYDLDVSGTPSILQCQVYVSDGSYSDTANLNITIIDKNDNCPWFQHAEYVFFVPVKSAVGTKVGQVKAYDADVGRYGTFIYYIEQESIANNLFKVSNNGVINLMSLLAGYPEKSILRFRIYAVDVGGLDTSTNVTILIPDTSVPPVGPEETPLYRTFFTYAPNMAWFVPSMFAVFGAVCVVIYTIGKAISEREPSKRAKRKHDKRRTFPQPRPRRQ